MPGLPTVEQQQHHQPADDSLCPSEALYLLMAVVVGRVPRNMSLTQLSTLPTLADGGPRRITDLAAIQGVAQPSITEMIAILERAGYVERHRDPSTGARRSPRSRPPAGTACVTAGA